jgi:choice-of-anchor A domain-containing protein
MKFNRLLVTILGLLLSSVNYCAVAGIINLGAAADYNAFIHQNFSATSSDVEGRVAAGGDVDISNYSVNIKGTTQLYIETDELPALVVGGDLNFSSGQVAGDVYVGGNYTPTGTGTITNGVVNTGGVAPIDFDTEFTNLIDLSTNLGLLTANSTATDKWSSQHLVGLGQNGLADDLHIFNLDASDMLFTDYFLSQIDKSDTVLFNISGTDIATSSGNFGGSDESLVNMSDNIIFNFFEAETLNINAALFGTILAPKADVEAPSGVIWGQVIANSWDGNTQINDNPFASNAIYTPVTSSITVPEPSSVAILALSLFGLFAFRRQTKL